MILKIKVKKNKCGWGGRPASIINMNLCKQYFSSNDDIFRALTMMDEPCRWIMIISLCSLMCHSILWMVYYYLKANKCNEYERLWGVRWWIVFGNSLARFSLAKPIPPEWHRQFIQIFRTQDRIARCNCSHHMLILQTVPMSCWRYQFADFGQSSMLVLLFRRMRTRTEYSSVKARQFW